MKFFADLLKTYSIKIHFKMYITIVFKFMSIVIATVKIRFNQPSKSFGWRLVNFCSCPVFYRCFIKLTIVTVFNGANCDLLIFSDHFVTHWTYHAACLIFFVFTRIQDFNNSHGYYTCLGGSPIWGWSESRLMLLSMKKSIIYMMLFTESKKDFRFSRILKSWKYT